MEPKITVFDREDKLLTVLSPDNPATTPFYDDIMTEKHTTGYVTHEFSCPADKKLMEYIVAENQVVVPDPEGIFIPFVIKQVETQQGKEGLTMMVQSEIASMELLGKNLRLTDPVSMTAGNALMTILDGTRWQPGIVETTKEITYSIGSYMTAIAYLNKLRQDLEMEIRYRVTWKGSKITGRYVDLLQRRGEDRGLVFEYGHNVEGISRVEDSNDLATALIGVGAEDSETKKPITFADVVWGADKPTIKPAGQDWVSDPEAVARWGVIEHIYEEASDEEDAEKLLYRTWQALQYRKNPKMSYSIDPVLLEQIAGYENEKVRIGDTVRVKNTDFEPPLMISARVIELKRSQTDSTLNEASLGEFRQTISKSIVGLQEIQTRLAEQAKAYAETKASQAQSAAQAYAESKAQEAQAAAEAVARAEAELAETQAKAYADGIVDAEEQARIDDANAKLAEAKSYAETKSGEAQAAAQSYAQQKAQEAQSAAEAVARAEATLAQVNAEAYADGKVSAEEQARIDQAAANLAEAKTHAEAKATEAESAAKAHTDAQLSDHDANPSPHNLPSYAKMESTGFIVYDDKGNKRTHNGQYAPGEFGNWVDAGFYMLRDKGMDMSLLQLPNLIPDHSFECILTEGSVDVTYHDLAVPGQGGNYFDWNRVNAPRVLSTRQSEGYYSEIAFGMQCVVVNAGNYFQVYVPCAPSKTYVLSGFACRGYRNPSAGTPRLFVGYCDSDVTQISYVSANFTPNSGQFDWQRMKLSFTTPSGCYFLRIVAHSTDSNYVCWDGLQLVDGTKPVRYEPEEALWRHMHNVAGIGTSRQHKELVSSAHHMNLNTYATVQCVSIQTIRCGVTTGSSPGNYVSRTISYPGYFSSVLAVVAQDIYGKVGTHAGVSNVTASGCTVWWYHHGGLTASYDYLAYVIIVGVD